MAVPIGFSNATRLDRRRARHAGRLLLVSPWRSERESYADHLGQNGFCVVEVKTAADAYQVAANVRLSAVVTEVSLPGQDDGLTLVKRLRQEAKLRQLPVAVLTGFVFGNVRQESASAGCDLFILKPCPPEVLCREIKSLLVRTAALRGNAVFCG
jgi:CheY-like chemotaxis protein